MGQKSTQNTHTHRGKREKRKGKTTAKTMEFIAYTVAKATNNHSNQDNKNLYRWTVDKKNEQNILQIVWIFCGVYELMVNVIRFSFENFVFSLSELWSNEGKMCCEQRKNHIGKTTTITTMQTNRMKVVYMCVCVQRNNYYWRIMSIPIRIWIVVETRTKSMKQNGLIWVEVFVRFV